jgi:hypothetical protein
LACSENTTDERRRGVAREYCDCAIKRVWIFIIIIIIIQLNGYLLTCRLSNTSANYKADINTQIQHKTIQIHRNEALNRQNKKKLYFSQPTKCTIYLLGCEKCYLSMQGMSIIQLKQTV